MRLLVVTPDYASHWYPLSAIAAAARACGTDVIVATGPALRNRIEADGFRWTMLQMSASSNAGIAGHDELDGFFTATTRGMVATLRQQAECRLDDLLWRPDHVARDARDVVDRFRPDGIVVDHLAFAAAIGLRATGVPYTTFVPGHPSQVPTSDERYGFPIGWPDALSPDPDALGELWAVCDKVTTSFTAAYNDALGAIDASAEPVADAFAVHGDDVLYNSPASLHRLGRALPPRHAFLGACVRDEPHDPNAAAWLDARRDDPFVYVSFGTFLSARVDVLGRVTEALRRLGFPVALSIGGADVDALGTLPPSWLVAPTLPQIALLERAACIVTHGGNNSVTEALAAGCPVVALPFSTDQFAVAADVERSGVGRALDPNAASPADIARAVSTCSGLAVQLAQPPGPALAVERILGASR